MISYPRGSMEIPLGYSSKGFPCRVSWEIPCESHISNDPLRDNRGSIRESSLRDIRDNSRTTQEQGASKDHTRANG